MSRIRSMRLLSLLRTASAALALQSCTPPCEHGICRSGACECEAGWAGRSCSSFLEEDPKVELSPQLLQMLESEPTGSRPRDGMEGSQPVTSPVPEAAGFGAQARGALKVAREALMKVQQAAAEGEAVLVQEAAEPPSPHATVKCEADCSGHGTCEEAGCVCGEEWTGTICDIPRCEQDCNQRGMCIHGKCICQDEWHGSACHIKRCPNDCSGAGYCFNGTCRCNTGFGGPNCSQVVPGHASTVVKLKTSRPVAPRPGMDGFQETASLHKLPAQSCPENCNQRGVCSPAGRCRCDAGYSGPACEAFCPNSCSGQGRCIEGGCLCFAGFAGTDCSVQQCCNGHGTCEVPGTCVCDAGWGGPECSVEVKCKDPTCSSHGTCIKGTCHCEEGWSSHNCGVPTGTCSVDCQHGDCNATTRSCDCEEGYTGEGCSIEIASCPGDCTFHGLCLNGQCMCGAGWSGRDCSVRYFSPGGLAVPGAPPLTESPYGLRGGRRADQALEEELGPEPRIGLDYQPQPEQPTAPMVPAAPQAAQAPTLQRLAFSLASKGRRICGPEGKCSGRGKCDTHTGRCICEANHFGEVCEHQHCPGFLESGQECHGNGLCDAGRCLCSPGYGGEMPGGLGLLSCHQRICPLGCGKGHCSEGLCVCPAGFTGETCQDPHCPEGCGHGLCGAATPQEPGSCTCDAGWSGASCEVKLPTVTLSEGFGQKHVELETIRLS